MIDISGITSEQIKLVYAHLVSRDLIKFEIPDEVLEVAGIDPKKMSPEQIKILFTKIEEQGLFKLNDTSQTGERKGLVKKKVTVSRKGKTVEEFRWVKLGDDEPVEKPGKGEEVPVEKPKPEKPKGLVIQGLNKPEEEKPEEEKPEEEKPEEKPEDVTQSFTDDDVDRATKIMKSHVKDLNKSKDGKKLAQSAEDYTTFYYLNINAYLRTGKGFGHTEEEPSILSVAKKKDLDNRIKILSDFIDGAPKVKGIVYRGMGWDHDTPNAEKDFNEFINNIEIGGDFELKPFTSTSTDEDMATTFAKNKKWNVVFEIDSTNGVFLDGLSIVPHEKEVLLDKNSNFTITGIDKSDPNSVKIKIKQSIKSDTDKTISKIELKLLDLKPAIKGNK